MPPTGVPMAGRPHAIPSASAKGDPSDNDGITITSDAANAPSMSFVRGATVTRSPGTPK